VRRWRILRIVEHDHSPDAIRNRLAEGHRPSYLRDWIYGAIDGGVTTLAIVSGVVGGGLPRSAILILGVANVIADGFSMAASNYAGTRTEHEERHHLEAVERRHIDLDPDGEREEIRQIFSVNGIQGEDLERVVTAVTADEQRWIRLMLAHEYGLPSNVRHPLKAAAATFAAFTVCGLIPLSPYVIGADEAFRVAVVLTLAVFFLVGAAKSHFSPFPWWRSGLETLAVGAGAAFMAYAVGTLLRAM
jgi:VIT1/CCC1 family predicted Fe2+/Mn2+ transporter